MRTRFSSMNSGNICIFIVGNRIAGQFNSDIIPQLNSQGVDVKSELKEMLTQTSNQIGLNMDTKNTKDLSEVVDKYVDIILKATKG